MSELAGPVAQQYFMEVKWDVGSIGVFSSDLSKEDRLCMSFSHHHTLLLCYPGNTTFFFATPFSDVQKRD